MKRSAPSFGKTVFPSPTGGTRRRGKIGVTPMGRCIQCGQVNDKRKTSWSKRGEGREGAPVAGGVAWYDRGARADR